MITLYHYIHCPFCVRVRMAAGFLKIPYKSIVLPYNDEKTPMELMGKKMLPIVSFGAELGANENSNESLDIIERLDSQNLLNFEELKNNDSKINDLLNRLAGPIHNLVMPYWVYTQEFDETSRSYFLAKKEKKRGPFNELMTKAPEFLKELSPILTEVEKEISPYIYASESLSILDIMLASHLWGMYVFPEFQFSDKIHGYLQRVKEDCAFNYHEDYWR